MKEIAIKIIVAVLVILLGNYFINEPKIFLYLAGILLVIVGLIAVRRMSFRKAVTPKALYTIIEDVGLDTAISYAEFQSSVRKRIAEKSLKNKDDIAAFIFDLCDKHGKAFTMDHRWDPNEFFGIVKQYVPSMRYSITKCEYDDACSGYVYEGKINDTSVSGTCAQQPSDCLESLNTALSKENIQLYELLINADGYAFLVATPNAVKKLKKNRFL